MRLNRVALGALATSALLVGGGGAALAASGDRDRGARCDDRLAKIAERRGLTVEQLEARIEARVLARIDAAEKAGRISPGRAANLRDRVSEGSLCGLRQHGRLARVGLRGMLRAAASFLDLDRAELREQLPGTSLAELAEKQGKSVEALEAAMVAPAKARLANAVAKGTITQARADRILDRLEALADRLASREFPQD
jgi:hypothetical protein